jgi:ribosomal protein S18 acetylase RimI-like enzyme
LSGAFEIRRFRPHELEVVVALWERAREDAQPWLEARMAWGRESNLRHFRDVVAREHEVWLAVEGDAIVGLLALGDGVVDQLHVDPPHQGRGVGTALLDLAKRRHPDGLALFTHQRNARARAFYESRGFRAVAFGTSPPPECEPDVRYAWRPGDAA